MSKRPNKFPFAEKPGKIEWSPSPWALNFFFMTVEKPSLAQYREILAWLQENITDMNQGQIECSVTIKLRVENTVSQYYDWREFTQTGVGDQQPTPFMTVTINGKWASMLKLQFG